MERYLNELTRRLHGYDEVAKILQFKHANERKTKREFNG
jgi:hypothetical protein